MSRTKKKNSTSPFPSSTPLKIGVRIPKWVTQNAQVIDGIIQFIREHQKVWQIDADIFFDNELPTNSINASWEGDGLIIFRCLQKEATAWHKKGIPVINISAETQIDGVPNVLIDNYQMGELAAEHLMGLGLHHFAYVGDSARNYSSQRFTGYNDTLKRNGLSSLEINIPISKMPATKKAEYIHTQLNKKLQKLPFPIGLLARDDLLALNVLRSAHHLDIQVPDNISLIGINDQSPFCQVAFPPLTSVILPWEKIGYHAANLLNQMIHGEKVDQDLILKSPGIKERESTNTIAVQDELVAKAIKYIRSHSKTQSVNVADICQQIGVSNTTLRLRFKKIMGRSIKSEVDRIRTDQIRMLLTETQLSIQEISYNLGFASPEDLTRFFTRMEGISPGKYRLNQR